MRRTIATLSAALALGAASLAPIAPARADLAGPAIAAGIGGFALGAITGGALANWGRPWSMRLRPSMWRRRRCAGSSAVRSSTNMAR